MTKISGIKIKLFFFSFLFLSQELNSELQAKHTSAIELYLQPGSALLFIQYFKDSMTQEKKNLKSLIFKFRTGLALLVFIFGSVSSVAQ